MNYFVKSISLLLALCLLTVSIPVCASETPYIESTEEAPRATAVPEAITEDPEAVSRTEETLSATEPVPAETQPQAAEETVPAETQPQTAEETVPAETQPQTVPEETELPSEKITEMPMYFQSDYPDTMYAGGTVASSGCSITSLAMVASYLTGYPYTPDVLADYFGGYIGNHMQRLEYASDQLQLPWRRASNWHDARQALWDGQVVIALMNEKSIFTDSQHFIVIYGVNEDGKFLVRDSAKSNYTKWNLERAFEEGFTDGDLCCGYSGAWIYEKTAMPEDPFIYEAPDYGDIECRYPDLELSEDDKQLLARMIWVEAQGEPFEGQQAIAEVVLNRIVAENFPNTLRGVVLAEGQFRSTEFLDDAEPTQTQYEAIEKAMYGPYVLPPDVVFFAQFAVNKNVWGTIGGHTFCYQWD